MAYAFPGLSILVMGYILGLAQLTRLRTARQAAGLGFLVGLLTAAPQLSCFWVIFGPGALALWCVVGVWIAVFVMLGRLALTRFGRGRAALLFPVLWMGLEYFRSELYYLKFSWLNVGYALSHSGLQPILHFTGMYGAGFLAMAVAARLFLSTPKKAVAAGAALFLAGLLPGLFSPPRDSKDPPFGKHLVVAGVQLEFPSPEEVLAALEKLVEQHPEAELLFLSEYTFVDSPLPAKILAWCRQNHRYLLVGGKDPAPDANFYDTAFVIGPTGEIVFRQGKSVPIQFFKDGLPATEQKLWESPWGKIGICICYDLSYTRVTDRLVRMGAQALLVPTMDVIDWGRHEHELHSRVAPARCAEYGIPIFRVASSGISQFVDSDGREITMAGFPGAGEQLSGTLNLAHRGKLPFDRMLAPFAVAATAFLIMWFIVGRKVKGVAC
jgi:apolipoprotein N-acyltransferase